MFEESINYLGTAWMLYALKSSLLLLLAFFASWLFRHRAARLRAALWVSVFIALLALPFLDTLLPSLSIPGLQLPASWQASASSAEGVVSFEAAYLDENASVFNATGYLALLIGLGTFLLVAYTLWGEQVLRRKSAVSLPAHCNQALERNRQSLQVKQQVGLKCVHQSGVIAPATYGWRKPFVLLPTAVLQWSEQTLDMVFLHELAHVKRRDALSLLLGKIVLCIHWFNPLAWLAFKQFREVCEQACDALALEQVEQPSSYAELLYELTQSTRGACASAFSPVVPMAQKSTLRRRIESILTHNKQSEQTSIGEWSALLLFVLGFLSFFAVVDTAKPERVTVAEVAASDLSVMLNPENNVDIVTTVVESSSGECEAPETNKRPRVLWSRGDSHKGIELKDGKTSVIKVLSARPATSGSLALSGKGGLVVNFENILNEGGRFKGKQFNVALPLTSQSGESDSKKVIRINSVNESGEHSSIVIEINSAAL